MELEKRGVSPVVGTILLIAITVAIAGVVGYFAMSRSPGKPAPTVSVEFDNVHSDTYNGGGFTVTHQGGDNIDNANLGIKVAGSSVDYSISSGTTFAVGDVITVDNGDNKLTLSSGDEIILIHKPSDSALASTEVD